jgi:hypothetical protein
MGVEVEGAGDQDVEAGVHCLSPGGDKVLPADGAVFGADEDRSPTLGAIPTFDEGAARADEVAGPWRQALEGYAIALFLLLDAFGLEVVDDDRCEILSRESCGGRRASSPGGIDDVDQFFLACRQHTVRR